MALKKYLLIEFLVIVAALVCYLAYTGSLKNFLGLKEKKPNVIVLLLDTLRSDHLSVYGYSRATTPNLDSFARDNILFKNTISAAPWTPPSVASIFTGLYPASHGMMPPAKRKKAVKHSKILSPDLMTLAERYAALGYRTAAVSSNPWIGPEFGYTQGFEDFIHVTRAPAEDVSKRGLKLLDKQPASEKPFFLYLHYLDPHDPYEPPGEFARKYPVESPENSSAFEYSKKMQELMALYDGEISYLDDELGKFFNALKKRSLYDDTVIVIVGDHGEQFMEQGEQGHGYFLYNTEIHVPLIVKAPGQEPKVIEQSVSTIDIYPTLAALSGFPEERSLQGINLLSDENVGSREGVLSEINHKVSQKSFTASDGLKIVYDCGASINKGGSEENCDTVVGLYDRNKNFMELAPIEDNSARDELSDAFKKAYGRALQLRSTGEGEEVEISDDTLKELKSLGYF